MASSRMNCNRFVSPLPHAPAFPHRSHIAADTLDCPDCPLLPALASLLLACDLRLIFAPLSPLPLQLGLPKEHAVSLCRPYKDHRESLKQVLAEKTLKLNGLEAPPKWRAEANLGGGEEGWAEQGVRAHG